MKIDKIDCAELCKVTLLNKKGLKSFFCWQNASKMQLEGTKQGQAGSLAHLFLKEMEGSG